MGKGDCGWTVGTAGETASASRRQDESYLAVPPERDYSPSDAGDSSADDRVQLMSASGPPPQYSAKDTVSPFLAPRAQIATAWQEVSQRPDGVKECPMPWDVNDLGFAALPASLPQESPTVRFFSLSCPITLRYQDVETSISSMGDLGLALWSGHVRSAWPELISDAKAVYREFGELLQRGDVVLYEVGEEPPEAVPGVLLDTPFPVCGGYVPSKFKVREVQVERAWRSMTKAFMDTDAPPWLDALSVVPCWWPETCYHGRRQSVNAFHDGDYTPYKSPLSGGSDHTLRIWTTPAGTRLYSYVVDLYDDANASIWADLPAIESKPAVRELGFYVLGSDHNSCFIDNAMHRLLSQFFVAEHCQVRSNLRMRYPKFMDFMRTCAGLRNKKSETIGLGWLSDATGVSVDSVIRAIALSPFLLPLSPHGNCFFGLFRSCTTAGGRSLGPICANLIKRSGLLSDIHFFARLKPNDRWFRADGTHLHAVQTEDRAGAVTDLEGEFGLSPINVPLVPLQRTVDMERL